MSCPLYIQDMRHNIECVLLTYYLLYKVESFFLRWNVDFFSDVNYFICPCFIDSALCFFLLNNRTA